MSTTLELAKASKAPAAHKAAALARAHVDVSALARRLSARLGAEWLPRAAWAVRRTGRAGLLGIALLLAAAAFLLSTYLPVADEVSSLRAEVAAAPAPGSVAPADAAPDSALALEALPARAEMPSILRQLFQGAVQARLALNTGKYDVSEARSGGLVRTNISFPVRGPYPQIRSFLDSSLSAMPALALTDLALERKAIGDASVEAQIRMAAYTRASARQPGGQPKGGAAAAAEGRAATPSPLALARVVAPAHADALFARHSWYVAPPPKPAPPPPAPPPPTAPPFPYSFLGSYAPGGEPPVFFLSRGDRVIDAHVGDRLDGVYQFESASGGQLVFTYLPLNTRHTLAAGASR